MARRSSAKRSRLIDDLLLEARRSGSLGALHSRAAAPLAGLNATDWDCLDVLDWTGPITAGELARRVGITSGAITGAIDRLETLGLVNRGADPNDRRKVIVRLADYDVIRSLATGRPLTEGFGALGAEIDEINDHFDDDQLVAIVQWLSETNAALERSIDRLRNAARARRLALLLAEEAFDLGGELVAGAQFEFLAVVLGGRLAVVVDPLQPGNHLLVLVVAVDELVEALSLQDHLAPELAGRNGDPGDQLNGVEQGDGRRRVAHRRDVVGHLGPQPDGRDVALVHRLFQSGDGAGRNVDGVRPEPELGNQVARR